MARELKFASTSEALQHLANVTCRQVKIAAYTKEQLKKDLHVELVDKYLEMLQDELFETYEDLDPKIAKEAVVELVEEILTKVKAIDFETHHV